MCAINFLISIDELMTNSSEATYHTKNATKSKIVVILKQLSVKYF